MSKIFVFICLAFFLTGVSDCFAQRGSSDSQCPKETSPGYPVILGDQPLYYLRDIKGPTGKIYFARERAREISERIREMADDLLKPITAINVSAHEQPITLIAAESDLLMAIFDEDAILEGRSGQELAAQYSEKLRTAIEKYRQDRSLRWIRRGAVFAFISTLFFIALLYLLNRLYRRAETVIQAWAESEKASIHVQSLELVRDLFSRNN